MPRRRQVHKTGSRQSRSPRPREVTKEKEETGEIEKKTSKMVDFNPTITVLTKVNESIRLN